MINALIKDNVVQAVTNDENNTVSGVYMPLEVFYENGMQLEVSDIYVDEGIFCVDVKRPEK